MLKHISYIMWYLFWVATALSCVFAVSPQYGPATAAVSTVFLLLYIWVSREPMEDAYVMRWCVYGLQIIGMIASAFATRSVTYFMIMGPTFLIHYHKEGGHQYA